MARYNGSNDGTQCTCLQAQIYIYSTAYTGTAFFALHLRSVICAACAFFLKAQSFLVSIDYKIQQQ